MNDYASLHKIAQDTGHSVDSLYYAAVFARINLTAPMYGLWCVPKDRADELVGLKPRSSQSSPPGVSRVARRS